MNSRGLAGMAGVFLLVVVSELNDNVTSTALVDVRGQLGIGYDPGTWLDSLYVSALVIGMSLSPWWFVTLTLRRFALGVCALCCCASTLIPFTSNIAALDALRLLQGFSEGLAIPLLMPTALRVLPPSARLYGLALYGLTSTGIPNLATGIAALWTEVVGWQFIFFQALPLCAVAATLILHGLPPEKPQYERIAGFDWRGALLVIIGFGSLTTLLQQGDRLDWFNSEIICVLALASVVAIPILVINEWHQELPLFRLRLLRRRNIAYGVIALFTFLIISLSSSTIPLTFLQEIQGYRPLQSYLVTVEIAASQLVVLPAVALLLDVEWIDARYVAFSGLALILAACTGDSFVTSVWIRDQFYLWQGFQSAGQAMLIVSLLMMATNSIVAGEGPFLSGLLSTPRALSEAVSLWLMEIIARWRGGLHSDRLVDQLGQERFSILHSLGMTPRGLAGSSYVSPAIQHLGAELEQQTRVLLLSDAFLVAAGLTVFLMLVLLVIPVRTYPPRIQLAAKGIAHG